ncbi:hypothetical protein M1N05_00390 [Dehalococcoidales bacterium]|nr:hypothetical protein [Dehalococcoidales bacterium]MCL0091633.1 hypothetical protein [Dehalococcoidales bacterium]
MHQRIYEKLKEIARIGKVTNYTDIGQMANLDMENPGDRNKIAEILDEINHYEHQQGRPMLSAVVIRQDVNMPGAGFFELARGLGKYHGNDDLVFWVHELTKVHNYWQSQQGSVQASLGILKDKGFTFDDFLKERQQERQKEIKKESKGI